MPEFNTNLWAPWRMEYIESLSDGAGGCFLCAALADPTQDEANHVIWRRSNALVLLNKYPYSSGHLLIAPHAHESSLEALDDEALCDLMRTARDAQRVLTRAVGAGGFNVGFNIGACAGAGLPDHVHCHVVPRWGGDVNYMAVIGDIKVMPIAMARTAERIRTAGRELGLS